MAYKYFRKTRKFTIAAGGIGFVKTHIRVKNAATARAGMQPRWVVVVGGSISEQTLATILGRTKRHSICVGAPCFNLALQLIDNLSQSDEGIL